MTSYLPASQTGARSRSFPIVDRPTRVSTGMEPWVAARQREQLLWYAEGKPDGFRTYGCDCAGRLPSPGGGAACVRVPGGIGRLAVLCAIL